MPIRVQLSRAKGWRLPPNTVVVDRRSQWGNPFRVGETVQRFSREAICETIVVRDRAHAVALHREWIELSNRQWPAIMRSAYEPLLGKNLACWCPLTEPCHADVLLELVNAPRQDGQE